MKQEDLRSRLLVELDCVTLDAKTVAGDLTPAQLAWHPPGGGWGVGQVLEHLVVVNDSYLSRMRPLIYARDAAHGEDGKAAWEPSVAGWILVGVLRSPRKFPTAHIWKVGPEARPDVLAAFRNRQQIIITFLRAAAALDWTRVRLSSPANRLVRLNLGDAFMALTVHAQRHIKQMERVRDTEGFPAA